MISRVADHCFWFGRYLERAESTARLLQNSANLALDGDLMPVQVWQPVVITAGEEDEFVERKGPAAFADGEVVQQYLALDREVAASLSRSIQAARENARSVREVISLEVWETINELHLWLQGTAAGDEFSENRYGFYRRIRSDAQLCLGLLRGTMLHDTAQHFIWLGVLIERTGQTARILDVHHHAFSRAVAQTASAVVSEPPPMQSQSMGGMTQSQSNGAQSQSMSRRIAAQEEARQIVDVALWLSLLRACYGFEPFLKLHRGPVTGEAAATFLIFEARFPRSVRHCVQRVRELLEDVQPKKTDRSMTPSRALDRARVLEEALAGRAEEPLGDVHELLTEVVDQMHAVCDELAAEVLGPPTPVADGGPVAISDAPQADSNHQAAPSE